MQRFGCCVVVLWLVLVWSCTPSYLRALARGTIPDKNAPDYSQLNTWAAHPLKRDPSDSIPSPLKNSFEKDTSVAVFFIHPTTLTSKNDTSWNALLSNDTLNAKTDYSTILYQASVFNSYQLYAPRYRQAHYKSYFTTDTARAKAAFDLAYKDVKAAFLQFLLQNEKKPFIIAAHSQGSTHAIRLLSEYFQTGPLKQRLIVAYILGMNIPSLGNLTFCKDSLETNCICGWRTFKAGYIPSYIATESGPGTVTNPLSWSITPEFISNTHNKGAVVRNFNKVYKASADAQVHDRVLWVKKLHFPGQVLLRTNNYHAGDINLFYVNIRENVKQRVRAYKSKHP
ncbi:MAG TPA: DUF3089 domain-containing protein [Flavitalea sp.]|nr:DUF3089 domain-containing protein [Flavitalea sp.]